MAFNKQKSLEVARKLRDKGQRDKAIKEYLKVVREDPSDVRVWLKIGDLYAQKGAKQEATDTYVKVAKFYSEQGFYRKAVAVYKQILKIDPRLVEVNLKLAELYRQLDHPSEAMQHFETVAAFFHREGKTKEALATIRQLVDLDPENVATRIKLAELYSKEQMVEEAVTEFQVACDYLRRNHRDDDYLKVAERLLWHKPERIDLARELADMYLRRRDPRRALQKLQACFKSDPRDVETLALLAQAFQALDQQGKTVSVLKELARVLTENGQRQQAEEVHRKILAYVPDDPDSRAALGDSQQNPVPERPRHVRLASIADTGETRAPAKPTGSMPIVDEEDDGFAVDLAMDEGPQLADGSSASAEVHADEIVKILTETDVYVKYGLHEKAAVHLRRVFDYDAENVEARERLKDILIAQGRAGDAVPELLRLAERTATADPDRAEAYLRELLELQPDHAQAIDMARRFRLDVTKSLSAAPVEIVDDGSMGIELDLGTHSGAHQQAPADLDDVLDFADLDLGLGGADGAARSSQGYDVIGAPVPPETLDPAEFDDLLDGSVDPVPSFDDGGGTSTAAMGAHPDSTMEVALDQVEESLAAAGGDDLDFEHMPAAGVDTYDVDLGRARAGHRPAHGYEHGQQAGYESAGYGQPVHGVGPSDYGRGIGYETAPTDAIDAPALSDLEAELSSEFDSELSGDDLAIDEPATANVPPEVMAQLRSASDSLDDGLDGSAEEIHDLAELGGELIEDLPSGDPAIVAAPPAAPASAETAGVSDLTQEVQTGDIIGAPQPGALDDDLDTADFFIAQGLVDEARDILESLSGRYPGNPLVEAKLAELAEAEGTERPEPVPEPADSFDSDLDVALADSKPDLIVGNSVEDSDAATHFDVGQACRGLGLFDAAIKEFQKVLALPAREVQCHLMIGLCYRDQNKLSEAITQFKAGLYVNTILEAEKLGLYYEIGVSYEALSDPQEALYYYEMLLKKDPDYRDVRDRVAGIKSGTDNQQATTALDGLK